MHISWQDEVVLGPDPDCGHRLFYAIPRNRWFVRRLETKDCEGRDFERGEDFALVGCTVVPGYDEEDIQTKKLTDLKSDFH